MFALTRAEHTRAQDLAEQLLGLAQRWRDPAFELPARLVLGITLWWQGEGVAARDHLEAGLQLYNPQQHRGHTVLYGLDHGVACGVNLGLVLWALWYADQAQKHHRRAFELVAPGLRKGTRDRAAVTLISRPGEPLDHSDLWPAACLPAPGSVR